MTLSEQKKQIGLEIIKRLQLEYLPKTDMVDTTFGKKRAEGLGEMVMDIINEAIEDRKKEAVAEIKGWIHARKTIYFRDTPFSENDLLVVELKTCKIREDQQAIYAYLKD